LFGSLLSLRNFSWTGWPSRPPAALTSLAHSSAPFSQARPSAENWPVSGTEIPTVTGLPADVPVAPPPHAATATADAAVKNLSAKNLARGGRLILFLPFPSLESPTRTGRRGSYVP